MINEQEITQAFKAADISSDEMKTALSGWYNLYYNRNTPKDEDPCQRIPYVVVNKISKTMFAEYSAKSDSEETQNVIEEIDKERGRAVQFSLIGGESFIKPVPTNDGFSFVIVDRQNMRVFGRDSKGHPTDIGTADHSTMGNMYYTLLERRTVDSNGFLTIRNMLYCSGDSSSLGQRVQLRAHPLYAQLKDVYTFRIPIGSIGMAQLKTPMVNCVDGSHDPTSVYAAAVDLIHNINRNEKQIDDEFGNAESRIMVSDDLLTETRTGRKLKDKVFVGLEEEPEEVPITIFSPAIREQSFLSRKQEYLRNIETTIGLKRGLLADVQTEERTATEVTSSAGDYNLTIIEFQREWEKAFYETLRLCKVIGESLNIPEASRIDIENISIEWGNGVLYDRDKTWAEIKEMVASGLLKPELALAWRYKLPAETEDDLKKIREKYMPEITEDLTI